MVEEQDVSTVSVRESAERAILLVLPEYGIHLERLRVLTAPDRLPTVTVVGKYNHGKSRLLNELMDSDQFSVADKRETTALASGVKDGVRWLDAPGLDADIDSHDDGLALHAVWVESDVRLFVHTAKEGELDERELEFLRRLQEDHRLSRRQNLFVLSQVDQLAGNDQLETIMGALAGQAPETSFVAVSSTRHRQGKSQDKKLLVQKSGIPALKEQLASALLHVPQARAYETAILFKLLESKLGQILVAREEALETLSQTQIDQRHGFDAGLRNVLVKIQEDLLKVVDAPGADHALTPDGADDKYKITAAKMERARIQIAYSRACIEIDGFLAGHGVIGLTSDKKIPTGSLYSVMVAVLGVSVKHRNDIRRIFGTPDGIQRLQDEFTRHYEVSADRLVLAQKVEEARLNVKTSADAVAALNVLKT